MMNDDVDINYISRSLGVIPVPGTGTRVLIFFETGRTGIAAGIRPHS